ncbi:melanoma-associated antigen B10-like isoform X2 [Canis lupus baileyi]|uniref:melanoma-associated antigen B10 isoform X2 n=1 Tax=Canis lupus dingo TaxID=286419 RepID=UPI0006B3C368|nr:melanoma-associated antigen B10 isoform X2 [Canis lupus dingo]XP_038305631.1 melanoma-associated antigen B10-like isoform X1 [Canis lupus familiaris]|eukprot:XP_013966929.1 melanoma-associated antigen B10-like isoform X1 [Canis lupus familiaris]
MGNPEGSLNHLSSFPHLCLLSLTRIIMPRGQKSKLRAREKRRQAREGPGHLVAAQATVPEEEESHPSPSHVEDAPQSSPATETPGNPQVTGKVSTSTTAAAAAPNTKFNEGASNQMEEKPNASQAKDTTEQWRKGPVDKKVAMLVYYLLYKYQMKEPITKADMLRNVIQMYKNQFHEILRKASEHLELVFGLDVKEVDPNRNTYVLVNKLESSCDDKVNYNSGVPKTGLLMTVLGVIFTKGNCATEEQVWEVLNMMGLYDGIKNFIYGEPRKLITNDWVKEEYLEYRQVANSDPPRYEFLWGPRAYAETSKMKVLEFVAKIHDTVPTAFPVWYEEALKDEEERARARVVAKACTAAVASARGKAMASSFSCPK